MSNILKKLRSAILEFLCYSIAIVATFSLPYIDIVHLKNYIEEISLTEIAQELIIVCIIYTFLRIAYHHSYVRYSSILIAGLFTCMLIRELDSILDSIFHGFWVYPAILVALIAIFYTFFKHPKDTINQLVAYSCHSTYGYMIAGLIAILIFSRLFGIKIIWQTLLDNNYNRIVKNVIEEGIELFGYSLCFVSTSIYRFKLTQAFRDKK